MNVLDLFSGIGGFSIGLERAGMRTIAFCEIDAEARKVLNKHWPNVPVFTDVTQLSKDNINEKIDVLAGGFPCQDISTAGRGAGISGSRSGLWFEYCRLIDEIRPRYAIIENVAALRRRGLGEVLRSLAEIGYDAEWHCIPASALGAPHQRDRIWIIAYLANAGGRRCGISREWQMEQQGRTEIVGAGSVMADADGAHSQGRRLSGGVYKKYADTVSKGWWEIEPSVGRVANGVPRQPHRLKQLGNAVVPQIPELIGRAIMEYERANALD
jgi:DNA (cytosine-5)-methyltransferase 1